LLSARTLRSLNLSVQLIEGPTGKQLVSQLRVVLFTLMELHQEARGIGNAELGYESLPAQFSKILPT
jgi:hypothetical protein